ncbi:hypothetical protein HPB52_003173 [Rhipicephalus sanguineus]|uniref:Uncharacterized protein n=1 Tax=Rhipicephalus sanguineus TaxID=34632 RepID=A0A9D4PYJ4_RHISA|nr:hypothetical protein HPB52_003173 [Rhipicephalus sanguineus]
MAPPNNRYKGIIGGVEVSEAKLRPRNVNHRNLGALEARRIKNTRAVVVLLEGMRVPNYVACGASIFRWTLYRCHMEVSYEFGALGHQADVSPNPESKSTLCGGLHPMAAKKCRHKFQVPYIVRRRRRQRRRDAEQLQGVHRPPPRPMSARGVAGAAHAGSAEAQHRMNALTRASSVKARCYKELLSIQWAFGVQNENP